MSKQYKFRCTFQGADGIRHDIKADSQDELIEKLTKVKQALDEGVVDSSMTVNKWAVICFEQYKTCGEYTRKNEVWRFNKWVGSEIGQRKLKDIKPLDCQRILNKASDSGLSHYTLRQISLLMRFVFQKAEENGLIRLSPARAITVPKGKPEQKRRALTADEDKYFIQACDSNPQYIFFLTMRLCGLRNSEVARLRGIDIIQKHGESFLHVTGTKTVASTRDVPLPVYLLDRLPKPANPFDYLFTNKNGGQLKKQNQRELWRSLTNKMQKLAGCRTYKGALVPPYPLATDLVSYELRHSYCTDLARDGVDMRTAQKLMGHADIKMIANVYSHIDDDMLIAEAKRVNLKDWSHYKTASNI